MRLFLFEVHTGDTPLHIIIIMSSNMDTDKKEPVASDASKSNTTTTAAEPPKPHTLQEDIQHNLSLIHSAVTILEPRLTTKVLRTTGAIRKRLAEGDAGRTALVEIIEANFPDGESSEQPFPRPPIYQLVRPREGGARALGLPTEETQRRLNEMESSSLVFLTADKQRSILLNYLQGSAGAGMQVDGLVDSVVSSIKGPLSKLVPSAVANANDSTSSATSRPATPASAGAKNLKDEFLPESDIYLTLLVILYLLDTKQLEKVSDNRPRRVDTAIGLYPIRQKPY